MPINFESQEINKNEEQDVVLGLIISTDFIKRIRPMYQPEYFNIFYTKTVAKWCIEYYDKYKKAPLKDIKSLFEAKKTAIANESKIELIDTFLSRISDRFEEEDQHYNVDYNVDKAKNYFKGSAIEILEERIKGLRLLGDYTAVEAEIAKFKRVEETVSDGFNFWDSSTEEIMTSLNALGQTNALLRLPGALGDLIRPLRRGDFLAVIGPAKRGKTFMLMEMALWATLNKCNVLFFSWEMPKHDLNLRFYQRLTGGVVPFHEEESEREVEIPFFDQNGDVFKRKVIKPVMNYNQVYTKINSMSGFVKNSRLRIECAPSKSTTPDDMRNILDNLEYYEDFVPDVIVTDYADICKPDTKEERRHQIDSVWMGHRAIGQERNLLMVTASHSNKQTLDRDIRESDLSEDARKLNHVTMALALNSSEEDKLNNSIRVRTLVDRHRGILPNKEALVLQCLECGQPYLDGRITNMGRT
ncbi:MAG: hypothetical protein GY853_01500 [PVC group bacterium]|nr:hypothetical protein [PVC group bacterium]